MSTRAQRRRAARAAATQHTRLAAASPEHVAVMLAWCATDADLPETRQVLHDKLIAMMGTTRTGGVSWSWWSGAEANDVLESFRADATGELALYYRQIAGHLREYGGLLVMASAPGRP